MRWTFSATDAAEAQGMRQAFSAYLRMRGGDEANYDAAEVIFGELVSNVVRHAPGPIDIAVEWTRGKRARMSVSDRGPGFDPSPGLPANPLAEAGRGLFLVSAFSGGPVHVERLPEGGCRVTVDLPVTRKDLRLDAERASNEFSRDPC